jgi:hypothetical protein
MEASMQETMIETLRTLKVLQKRFPTELGVFSARKHFSKHFPAGPGDEGQTKAKTLWKQLAFKFIAESVGLNSFERPLFVVFGDSEQEISAGKSLQQSCKNSVLKTVRCPQPLTPVKMGKVIQTLRKYLAQLSKFDQSQHWQLEA